MDEDDVSEEDDGEAYEEVERRKPARVSEVECRGSSTMSRVPAMQKNNLVLTPNFFITFPIPFTAG